MTIYFFKETDPDTGYLSQWAHSPFRDEAGRQFQNAEQYMMYHKALFFGDADTAREVLLSPQPRAAKRLGRQVRNFDDAKWRTVCEAVLFAGNEMKFRQNADLLTRLLSTGEAEPVEASHFDRVYGIGFRAKEAARNRHRWGLNILGKQLCEVRKALAKEEA